MRLYTLTFYREHIEHSYRIYRVQKTVEKDDTKRKQ